MGTGQKQVWSPAAESQAFLQLAKLGQDHTLVGMKLLGKVPCVPRGELACSEYTATTLDVANALLTTALLGVKSQHKE